jgi:Spy/CpxP family protein refolding chaperone
MSQHRTLNILIALSFLSVSLFAQTVPPDREGLENGEGLGMGLFAELNGYPGPLHVLELRDSLELTDTQLKQTQAIFDEMKHEAVLLGRAVIAAEESLYAVFRRGNVQEDEIQLKAEEIGQVRSQLRTIHLRAHLQTREILSDEQRTKYMRLRGRLTDAHH